MKWKECFEMYKYKSLFSEVDNKKQKILKAILFEDGIEPDELKEIYLSEREDELFIILQINQGVNVNDLSNEWDAKILAFINFGENLGVDHLWIEKIKYNITQILLYNSEMENKDLEKSVDISRKIFLKCDENGELNDNERVRLPFLYDEFNAVTINENQNNILKNMLPDKNSLPFLYKKHNRIDGRSVRDKAEQMVFLDDELEGVEEWIGKE